MDPVEKFLRMIPHRLLFLVLAVNVTFLLLLAFSFLFIQPGSDSFVVAILAMIPIGLMLIATALLIYLKPTDY